MQSRLCVGGVCLNAANNSLCIGSTCLNANNLCMGSNCFNAGGLNLVKSLESKINITSPTLDFNTELTVNGTAIQYMDAFRRGHHFVIRSSQNGLCLAHAGAFVVAWCNGGNNQLFKVITGEFST
jgi:hypothetical protein